MQKLLIFAAIPFVACCNTNHKTQDPAMYSRPKNEAKLKTDSLQLQMEMQADRLMILNGFKLEKLSRKIFEDSANYYVIYKVASMNYKGGGGHVTFRKSDMQIVESKFEE